MGIRRLFFNPARPMLGKIHVLCVLCLPIIWLLSLLINFSFVPVTALLLIVWALITRPLLIYFRAVGIYTRIAIAPPLAVLLTFMICSALRKIILPDTYLCQWGILKFPWARDIDQ